MPKNETITGYFYYRGVQHELRTVRTMKAPLTFQESTVNFVGKVRYEEVGMIDVPESHRDLLESQVATLATIGPSGRPQLTEVWFLYENDSVALSLTTGRQKTKNLLARPQCSLLILDLAAPQRYLELRGEAEVTPDDGSFLAKVDKKYDADLRAFDGPGVERVVARIVPRRINAVDMRG
jgi:PPOX class probable F420-dependent enzyme